MHYQKSCVLIAGVCGIVPTISRLAGTYVADPATPMPAFGLYFGLLLFFVIGSVLAYAFSETEQVKIVVACTIPALRWCLSR